MTSDSRDIQGFDLTKRAANVKVWIEAKRGAEGRPFAPRLSSPPLSIIYKVKGKRFDVSSRCRTIPCATASLQNRKPNSRIDGSLGIETVTLYRPVGPRELDLIAATDCTRFPPRLPEQPIFYPVANEACAHQIARDWNVKSSGSGYVLRFTLPASFLDAYPIQQVGTAVHREYWIPAEDLETLNDRIVGRIELIASYGTR